MTDKDQFNVFNYAAAFIDLLGQKEALAGCSLVPNVQNEATRNEFISTIKASIGAIQKLHQSFRDYFDSFTNYRSELAENLPPDALSEYKKLRRTNLKFQRFSDGLVAYVSLGDPDVPVPLNSVFGLIASCGGLCLLGLAMGEPLRIGIDVAWGVELENNELYGCVIAKSHELESKVAVYPRVVIGEQFIDFLTAHLNREEKDPSSALNKRVAHHCLEMIAIDYDGYHIVNYLGPAYKKYAATSLDATVYSMALTFVIEQLHKWRTAKRSDLAFRYTLLESYFEHNREYWTGNSNESV